jgi:transcriptional regulator with XRE-family HTH domain
MTIDKIDVLSNIIHIRRINKITQKELAKHLGINNLTLSRYERCERDMPITVLNKYVEYLGYKLGIFKI